MAPPRTVSMQDNLLKIIATPTFRRFFEFRFRVPAVGTPYIPLRFAERDRILPELLLSGLGTEQPLVPERSRLREFRRSGFAGLEWNRDGDQRLQTVRIQRRQSVSASIAGDPPDQSCPGRTQPAVLCVAASVRGEGFENYSVRNREGRAQSFYIRLREVMAALCPMSVGSPAIHALRAKVRPFSVQFPRTPVVIPMSLPI